MLWGISFCQYWHYWLAGHVANLFPSVLDVHLHFVTNTLYWGIDPYTSRQFDKREGKQINQCTGPAKENLLPSLDRSHPTSMTMQWLLSDTLMTEQQTMKRKITGSHVWLTVTICHKKASWKMNVLLTFLFLGLFGTTWLPVKPQ